MGCGPSRVVDFEFRQLERPFIVSWGWVLDPHLTRIPPVKSEHFNNICALGKGKFGLVFMSQLKTTSTNNVNSKYVAIKYIPKQIIHECKCIARIQQELDIIHTLNHPFICHCFGSFDDISTIGIVFELAMGGELYTRIRQLHTNPDSRNGYTIESIARFYIGEIALALHYLHDVMHIVYRDLKPENILIDQSGHVKLCDFGFAVRMSTNVVSTSLSSVSGAQGLSAANSNYGLINAGVVGAAGQTPGDSYFHKPLAKGASVSPATSPRTNTTSVSMASDDNAGGTSLVPAYVAPPEDFNIARNPVLYDGCGTAMYVAPEIAGGFMKQNHSYPVDWWALGVILYEIVIGTAPFGDTDKLSKFEVFNNVLQNRVTYPLRCFPDKATAVSMKCKSLISSLLKTNPAERFRYNQVRCSDFMKTINFETLFDRRIHPPWVPVTENNPVLVSNSNCGKSSGWGQNGSGSSSAKTSKSDIALNFVEWEKKIELPSGQPSYDVTSYCKGIYFPRPLTIAVKGPPPSTPPPLARSASSKSFKSPLAIANNTGSNSNALVPHSNGSVGSLNSNKAANHSHNNNTHNYEYDPDAAGGVVLKRAWQENIDLQYEKKNGRNSRVRPLSKKEKSNSNLNANAMNKNNSSSDLKLNLSPIKKNTNSNSQANLNASSRNSFRGISNDIKNEHQEKLKQQKSKRSLYNV